MLPPGQPINPMQGGAGGTPDAGGPPPPMGQPAGQTGAPPPAAGPGSAPGMPQAPGGGQPTGINAQEILQRAMVALKAGQISQQQFDLIKQKLMAAMGGGGPGGAPPAAAQPALGQPSPQWG